MIPWPNRFSHDVATSTRTAFCWREFTHCAHTWKMPQVANVFWSHTPSRRLHVLSLLLVCTSSHCTVHMCTAVIFFEQTQMMTHAASTLTASCWRFFNVRKLWRNVLRIKTACHTRRLYSHWVFTHRVHGSNPSMDTRRTLSLLLVSTSSHAVCTLWSYLSFEEMDFGAGCLTGRCRDKAGWMSPAGWAIDQHSDLWSWDSRRKQHVCSLWRFSHLPVCKD